MYLTYHINTSELDSKFINSIKSMFPNKTIEIKILDKHDDTEYLHSNAANSKKLLKSIENIKKGKKLVELDLTQLKQIADEKSSV